MAAKLQKLPNTVRGQDYIETKDWSVKEIELALKTADNLKKMFRKGKPHRYLPDKTVFLFFFDKSTRTRNSFEAGATQLGAHAHFISSETSQVAHGESPKDMGIILSSYGHAIAVRHDLVPGEGNSYMRKVADAANVPVLNMQCDIDHPFQVLADLMTIREEFGKNLRGKKIAVSWAYAPSYVKPMSVPQGLITLMPRFGLDVVLAHPPEYTLMKSEVEYAKKAAAESGTKFEIVDDMDEAFKDADIVYPKSWGIESLFHNPNEALEISKKYKNWICDERRMSLTKKDSIYMHCLPADRGYEVVDSVIDGPHSRVFPEAENRLHTAKAIMALTM
ncbi:MAG: ornithine carbamoyltransferase [Bacteroidetes bacterium]|nr:ornithine carbamoyltransferase [Bacteroidota bacterium]MCW5895331.1 ornithine carbamoyltransferase [Bacteroidota bacterium]